MNFGDLDLNLLVVLDALFEERQTTRVAVRLKISQPTVSHALNKLRLRFNDELFVREGNIMQPTPVAETLREPVRSALQLISTEIMRDRDFNPETTRRRFTLSMSDIGELVFLPKLLKALGGQASNATIRCVSMPPRDLEAAMADGSVDIALGYFPDLIRGAFYQQKLFEHRFVCLVRKDHPTIGDTISLEQFLASDHAVVTQEGRSQEVFERRMQELRLERHVLLQSQHYMSIPLLVSSMDVITTVPRAVGRAYASLAAVKLLEPPIEIPTIELKQLWHRRVHFDPAIIWLRSLIASIFLGKDPSEEVGYPIFEERFS